MATIRRRVASPVQPPVAPQATTPAPRARTRRSSPASSPQSGLVQPGAGVRLDHRYQIEYIDLNDIIPYEYNPRDNEKAIPAVANSIRSFGFLVPCVIDSNNVLVAGHTRTEAAKLLGMTEVPCIRASGLSQAQINAFRLMDNKVAEQASWDYDMLAGEIGKLAELGLDFTKFGWSQEEIDCLSDVVAAECLTQPVTTTNEEQEAVSARRAPITARVVIGELVFFLPAAAYRNWVDGVRALNDFNEDAIIRDLKRRLGMLE